MPVVGILLRKLMKQKRKRQQHLKYIQTQGIPDAMPHKLPMNITIRMNLFEFKLKSQQKYKNLIKKKISVNVFLN